MLGIELVMKPTWVLPMQLKELMAMEDGTGHGAATMLGQPGLLGRRKSSCYRPYRGLFRHHICGRQDLLQQRVVQYLWRCYKSGALSKGDDRGGRVTHPFRARQLLR